MSPRGPRCLQRSLTSPPCTTPAYVDKPGHRWDSGPGRRRFGDERRLARRVTARETDWGQMGCRVGLAVLLGGESDQLGHFGSVHEYLGQRGVAFGDLVTLGGELRRSSST